MEEIEKPDLGNAYQPESEILTKSGDNQTMIAE
jgi:hypothetical protein